MLVNLQYLKKDIVQLLQLLLLGAANGGIGSMDLDDLLPYI